MIVWNRERDILVIRRGKHTELQVIYASEDECRSTEVRFTFGVRLVEPLDHAYTSTDFRRVIFLVLRAGHTIKTFLLGERCN